MPTATIYHNPRCSKSRATLAILETLTTDIEIVKYLDNPPTEQQLAQLLKHLGVNIDVVLRKTETDFKKFGFDQPDLTETAIIKLLHQHPKVMERPIVTYQNKAIIGRPPENVLNLFKDKSND